MKMSGERLLDAPRPHVWAKLNDPEVLQRCIPGCEALEMVSDTQLKATVAVKIGPMKARFKGDVELSDVTPPESYRISGSGTGGAAGSASGGADVKLEDRDGATLLTYDVDAQVKGKMAQLGGRLIDATAASLANQFFDRFAAEFPSASADEPDGVPDGAVAEQKSHAAATGSGGKDRGSLPPWIWWALAGAAIAALIGYALNS